MMFFGTTHVSGCKNWGGILNVKWNTFPTKPYDRLQCIYRANIKNIYMKGWSAGA